MQQNISDAVYWQMVFLNFILKANKQPHFIYLHEHAPFAFGGLGKPGPQTTR